MRNTSISLPEKLEERLEELSKKTGNPRSSIIRTALHQYLDDGGINRNE